MFEVISIGSATEDVFVFIKPKVFKGNIQLIPGSKVEAEKITNYTGGGATNTAVGFSRIGLKTGIIAVIGNDESGKTIEEEMIKEKVSVKYLFKSKTKRTHYSVILTGFHRQRVILTYRGATGSLEDLNKIKWSKVETKWIHLSSLHGSFALTKKIINSFNARKTKISWNPGKKELKQGLKKLSPLLKKTSILFVNETEAEMLTGKKDIKLNLKLIQKHCPIIALTDGPRGAYCFDGKKMLFINTLNLKVLDATGAGDSFCSGFVSALIKEKPIETAMTWGMIESQSVITHLGTKNDLLNEKKLTALIEKNKKKIKLKEIK
ncbi:MAG: carbohydrate kinase family protein [Candidatus Diapherotrites archaeon]|nr:carbohydrate kinase family protein [Candidatus Diapherotrites archaeon]